MLGILGGTFDPIHYGHLNAAWQALEELALDEVRFMPCHRPAHREMPTAASHRLHMLQLAIQQVPSFTLDERELTSDAISYTVNSLRAIRSEVGNTPICLLLGLDAFNQIATWHQPLELLKLAHIIVIARPEILLQHNAFIDSLLTHTIKDPSGLKQKPAGSVYFMHNTMLYISATHIRKQLKEKQLTPRFLLPDAVLQYIEENRLYLPQ